MAERLSTMFLMTLIALLWAISGGWWMINVFS